jgi:hypothetical protein
VWTELRSSCVVDFVGELDDAKYIIELVMTQTCKSWMWVYPASRVSVRNQNAGDADPAARCSPLSAWLCAP